MGANLHELNISSYDFDLPQELIAQHPLQKRQDSRLFLLQRSSGQTKDCRFADLPDLLPRDALLVRNVSRVFPARLFGRKVETNAQVEFLLTTPLALINQQIRSAGEKQARVQGLCRPLKHIKAGQRIEFGKDLQLVIQEKKGDGLVTGILAWQDDLYQLLQSYGQLPLPPYIKRQAQPKDLERYQTVYARQDKTGSVAAPTAGLHFNAHILKKMERQGLQWADISLYVGYGTFSPLRVQDVRTHTMHAEYIEISHQEAQKIEQARLQSRPVIAVGTTTVRALESVMRTHGAIRQFSGWSDLFIYPGFEFQIVRHLITNFHLPRSSLLLMVSAFAGRQNILAAYRQAIAWGYRFFSYGDCMLIL